MRLGIDVGRSYTDAVLTSENGRIFARTKSTKGEDSVENTRLALSTIFGQIKGNEASIKGIFVCSSHIEQALNEAERLAKTYLVRISPMPSILQPAVDWPEDLQDHIVGTTHLSSTEDDQEWDELIVKIKESDAQSIAVVGVNAPMDAESERRLGAKITVRLPELAVSLSHQFGSIGFIERENTTLLNAMLRPATVLSKNLLHEILSDYGVQAPVWIAKHDGTLMTESEALGSPIKTIASNRAMAFQGAGELARLTDYVVVNVGENEAGVAVVKNSKVDEASLAMRIDGIRTTISLPSYEHVEAIPERLKEYERLDIERKKIQHPNYIDDFQLFCSNVRSVIERVQPRYDELPIVLVGSRSETLFPHLESRYETWLLPDASNYSCAYGLCFAMVGSESDGIYHLKDSSKQEVIEREMRKAEICLNEKARFLIRDQEVEEYPFCYLDGEISRIRVRVKGSLQLN
ncbi:hypothetical protein DH09_11310 [Bacillaceae bacterium JMAK1]|nr:hypothetical protein DH09_11310 [Bacillaceae bacterium JMAK1]